MYEIYETGELEPSQAYDFARKFARRVGTETEVTRLDNGLYAVTCFEITQGEVKICREIEKGGVG